MNEIRTRTLEHARRALLAARGRCLLPGYYSDTMAARVTESTSLLRVAMAAAKMAAAVLAQEPGHAALAALLRKAATRRSFILELDPAELDECFALALQPPEQQEPPAPQPAAEAVLDE